MRPGGSPARFSTPCQKLWHLAHRAPARNYLGPLVRCHSWGSPRVQGVAHDGIGRGGGQARVAAVH